MITFKLFFEDFNNWRKPTGAIDADRNLDWKGGSPLGFKGSGPTGLGRDLELRFKSPKEKQPKRQASLLRRKQRQQKLIALSKAMKQMSRLLLGIRR